MDDHKDFHWTLVGWAVVTILLAAVVLLARP